MSSKVTEDKHTRAVDKLLAGANLECFRVVTPEEEEPYVEVEFEVAYEFSPEEVSVKSEEIKSPEPEQKPPPKHEPQVFPTPSLRRVIPRYQRQIEEDNRIRVLPEKFNTDIDPFMIPKIKITPPKVYIDILAEITGCGAYSSNFAEYWFLDTLANVLRRAQDDYLSLDSQATLIKWFCEWMKEMQYFDAADRCRMMRRWKAVLPTEKTVIPTPTPATPGTKPDSTTDSCALFDLAKITHYIYDLFSTDYQYNLIRSIFTFGPDYSQIKSEFGINRPKKLFAVPKVKAVKPAKPATAKEKKKDTGKKGQPVETEPPPSAYLYLMELKETQEKELNELYEKDREESLLRSSILPLAFADCTELTDLYWPPPPPEPEPIVIHMPMIAAMTPKKGKKK